MDVLDTNILNTAIPVMALNFNVHPVDLKIALISYLLSLAIFIPISGWTADKFGTKPIFILALGLFTLSSFFCGYSKTLMHLTIARSIQGVGGAFMISLGRLIIAKTFKRHELVEAMNTVIIVVALGVMMGPYIGGFITDHFSWPWIFWVNLPAGLLGIILAIYSLNNNDRKIKRPFDTVGFILFGGSLSLLCFSLSQLSETHSSLAFYGGLFFLSLLMLFACLWHVKNHPHPIIKIQLFKIRTFRISVFGNLCSRLGFGGMPFLLPLMQQLGLGFNAELSGLLLVPIAVGIIFAKLFSFRILRRIGYKYFLIANTFFVALALALFQIITIRTPIFVLASLTFVYGTFTAAQYTAMNSLAFSDLKQEDLSASTSITSTAQILAQTLGVALSALLLRFFSASFENSPVLTLAIFHETFLFLSILTIFSIGIFLHLKMEDGHQMLKTESD